MSKFQESLKMFYLGLKDAEPFLYKNKDLTTHAAIIGMTGSGKTGLGITLLEEACIDNIPSIVIDPKGDMTNLCLAFPNLTKDDFFPYMDETEATNKGVSLDELASDTAKMWQDEINSSFQDSNRIKLFKQSADFRIYTPKSSVGLGVSLLNDFEAPNILNEEDLNNYVSTIASSILSLVGVKIDDVTSPEMLLLQHIFITNFSQGRNVTIADLIMQIANPPFDKIGIFDINTFFTAEKRMALSMKINAFMASPSFAQWCYGERLNIGKMLFSEDGKARCNIFTISHLSDSERMFFVTLLLNEIIRWMRTTEGTSSLRAILYMDEIFGFFPPTSNPPSKTPMLTLLKQARAFGLGCVLSTQNPVDLDYKGLSNIGTWFIGRLQTAQDKERVISGLTGISDSNLDKDELMRLISNLQKRNFLVKNINEDVLFVISTRFALSYLKGPLKSAQISNLMAQKKLVQVNSTVKKSVTENVKPVISSAIQEIYSYGISEHLRPYLYASASVRYNDNKNLDFTKSVTLCYDLEDSSEVDWSEASIDMAISVQDRPKDGFLYEKLLSYIASAKDLKAQERSFKDYIYRNLKLELFSALGINSNPKESKEEFFIRLQDRCDKVLEDKTEEFTQKFEKEKQRLNDKLNRAYDRLQREQKEVKTKGIDAIISIGSSVLGAIFGGKTLSRTNMGKVATGARSANRVLDAREDVKSAQESVELANAELQNLSDEFQKSIIALKDEYNIKNINLEIKEILPKKSDIFNEKVVVLWRS